jgi:GDP-L-fucose synthase
MPNNLYGKNDNFDLKTSHVLPALIRKFHEAKEKNINFVEIWGSGKPMREFLHVNDMVEACIFLINNLNAKDLYGMGICHINAGSGDEISIQDLALLIKEIVGYNGGLKFNDKYPDGMNRKLLDIKRITKMGWKSTIKLKDGISELYKWDKQNSNLS